MSGTYILPSLKFSIGTPPLSGNPCMVSLRTARLIEPRNAFRAFHLVRKSKADPTRYNALHGPSNQRRKEATRPHRHEESCVFHKGSAENVSKT
jgi:hypothetical protein